MTDYLREYERIALVDTSPSRRTKAAYERVFVELLYDGETVPRAFGEGGYEASFYSDPYDTFDDAVEAAKRAREGRGCYRVSNANHGSSFCGMSHANFAFRVHHDAVHILEGLDFSFASECAVARHTIRRLHLLSNSDAAAVVVGEVIGQGLYYEAYGRFPTLPNGDQPVFSVTNESVAWSQAVLREYAS